MFSLRSIFDVLEHVSSTLRRKTYFSTETRFYQCPLLGQIVDIGVCGNFVHLRMSRENEFGDRSLSLRTTASPPSTRNRDDDADDTKPLLPRMKEIVAKSYWLPVLFDDESLRIRVIAKTRLDFVEGGTGGLIEVTAGFIGIHPPMQQHEVFETNFSETCYDRPRCRH